MIPRKNIPATVRFTVWNTYIGKTAADANCWLNCGNKISQQLFECGHIMSVKDGGSNDIRNLRPICGLCNKSIGSSNMDEFKKHYGYEKNKQDVQQVILNKNISTEVANITSLPENIFEDIKKQDAQQVIFNKNTSAGATNITLLPDNIFEDINKQDIENIKNIEQKLIIENTLAPASKIKLQPDDILKNVKNLNYIENIKALTLKNNITLSIDANKNYVEGAKSNLKNIRQHKYYCKYCKFSTENKFSFSTHNGTDKHHNNVLNFDDYIKTIVSYNNEQKTVENSNLVVINKTNEKLNNVTDNNKIGFELGKVQDELNNIKEMYIKDIGEQKDKYIEAVKSKNKIVEQRYKHIPVEYYCKYCNFVTGNKHNFAAHNETAKHNKNLQNFDSELKFIEENDLNNNEDINKIRFELEKVQEELNKIKEKLNKTKEKYKSKIKCNKEKYIRDINEQREKYIKDINEQKDNYIEAREKYIKDINEQRDKYIEVIEKSKNDIVEQKDKQLNDMVEQRDKAINNMSATMAVCAKINEKPVETIKNALTYANTNFNKAPALTNISNFEYFDEKDIIEELQNNYYDGTLNKYMGDIIISIYKKENAHDQSLWNTDSSRLAYIIRKKTKQNIIWEKDRYKET
jgi:hypothetical protein